MANHRTIDSASAGGGLPISPSLEPTLAASGAPREAPQLDRRTLLLCLISMVLAVAAALIARLLTAVIGLVTNLAYYGRVSTAFVSPAGHHLGWVALFIPAIGGLIVGVMARYGSRAIRGHGIPEAMEQILSNGSRIPPRITFLKPLSAAIAIGTGGPFGAEGPIIATGGALGSFVGQILKTTAVERKILLAAGATAGMTATFGSPVAAVILAIELLLFEFRPRSIIPVALACATAACVRFTTVGAAPVFPIPDLRPASASALLCYLALGAIVGVASVWVTRLVYAIEDGFERLPIGWVWWPAIGGLAVGVVGLVAPHTLGVGYDNIEHIVGGTLAGRAVLVLCLLKLVSWSISLGSGTSGGTLAPLFTIGGGLGASLGGIVAALAPHLGIDVRVAALVGMAAMFAGASRALLTSIVFAFETTQQPMGLLPLLAGCTTAYLLSSLLMKNTIMTEKIVRRGVRVPSEYGADYLEQVLVAAVASHPVVTLAADDDVGAVQRWLSTAGAEASHQGFPVVAADGELIGVLTRRDLLAPAQTGERRVRDLLHRPPAVIFTDSTLRAAADHMVREGVGRLPVVTPEDPSRVVGIITRSDLLTAHSRRLEETHSATRHIRLRQLFVNGSTKQAETVHTPGSPRN
jgi:CIC family chloride channel protein